MKWNTSGTSGTRVGRVARVGQELGLEWEQECDKSGTRLEWGLEWDKSGDWRGKERERKREKRGCKSKIHSWQVEGKTSLTTARGGNSTLYFFYYWFIFQRVDGSLRHPESHWRWNMYVTTREWNWKTYNSFTKRYFSANPSESSPSQTDQFSRQSTKR